MPSTRRRVLKENEATLKKFIEDFLANGYLLEAVSTAKT